MLAESINSRHLVIQCSNIPQKGDVTIRKKGWHALQNPEVEPNTMNDTDGLHMNSAVENTIGDLDAFDVTAAVDVNQKKDAAARIACILWQKTFLKPYTC